jgi:hypothetical protein
VPAGRLVRLYAADPYSLQRGNRLATVVVDEDGWVDPPQAIVVRAGEVFVVFSE